MYNFRILSVFVAVFTTICSGALAQAEPPAGTCTGVISYEPNSGSPIVRSENLRIAYFENTTGSCTLSFGEKLQLNAGTPGSFLQQPFVWVGRETGTNGTLTVTGAGSELSLVGNDTGATLQVGWLPGARGTLNISDGGTVTISDPTNTQAGSSASLQLGLAGGTGFLNVDAGTLDISSTESAFLFMGATDGQNPDLDGGRATAVFENGSVLRITDLDGGTPKTGSFPAAAIVMGQDTRTGTSLTFSASSAFVTSETANAGVVVGREFSSQSVLRIVNGSTLDIAANTLGSNDNPDALAYLLIGRGELSTGVVQVNSSQVNLSGPEVFIGVGADNGADFAELFVTNSDLSISADNATIEVGGTGGVNRLFLTNNSTLSYAGEAGEIRVTDYGALSIQGSSSLTFSGDLIVAYEGPADVSVGTELYVASSTITVDSFTLSGGTGLDPDIGRRTYALIQDSRVETDQVDIFSGGQLDLRLGSVIQSPVVNVWQDGVLAGDGGTVIGTVNVADGGVVSPGASPGIFTIEGDLNLAAGAILELEFGGTTPGEDYDVLNVTGNVEAGGMFDLVVSFIDGYVPEVGELFDFLNVDGVLADDFFALATVDVLGLGAGSLFSFVENEGGFALRADVVSAVPVPSSLSALLLGMGGLGLLRRRRRMTRMAKHEPSAA